MYCNIIYVSNFTTQKFGLTEIEGSAYTGTNGLGQTSKCLLHQMYSFGLILFYGSVLSLGSLLFIYVDESPANWENVLEGIRKMMYSIDTTGDREDADIHPPKV